MREHKYRAWDKKRNRWFRSYDEGLIWYGFHIIGECTMIDTPRCEEFENIEITEFTGKKDKNDKDVYEGDIIKCGEFIYEVYYNEKMAGYYIRNDDEFDCSLSNLNNYEIEIINYIYVYKKKLKKGK